MVRAAQGREVSETFIGYVILDPLLDGENFRLTQAVRYSHGLDHWTVPEGFVTDLASIPRVFRWLLGRWGRYGWAAVLHDAMYRGLFPGITRGQADYLLLVFMEARDTPTWQQVLIYAGVRLGGWVPWMRYRG